MSGASTVIKSLGPAVVIQVGRGHPLPELADTDQAAAHVRCS